MSLVPVRLCDLNPRVLKAAANRCARNETDPLKVAELLLAAEKPSQTTYWLPAGYEGMVDALRRPVVSGNVVTRHETPVSDA